MHTQIHTQTHTYTNAHRHMHTHIHALIHTQTHIYINSYKYTCTQIDFVDKINFKKPKVCQLCKLQAPGLSKQQLKKLQPIELIVFVSLHVSHMKNTYENCL